MNPTPDSTRCERFALLALSMMTLATLLTACGTIQEPRWAANEPAQSTVTFASPRLLFRVDAAPGPATNELRGTVQPRLVTSARAPEPGVIAEYLAERGEPVEKEQPVVRMESTPSEAQLLAVQILQLEVDLAIAEARSASEIAAAQTAVDEAREALAPRSFTMTAPASGLLSNAPNPSRIVAAGEVVFAIADPSSLAVFAQVSPVEIEGIEPGAPATMIARDGVSTTVIDGIVGELPPSTDSPMFLPVELPVDAGFALGQQVNVSLLIEPEPGSAWLDRSALQRESGSNFVLVEGPDGLRRVSVTLGRTVGEMVEILSGLAVGDEVVGP